MYYATIEKRFYFQFSKEWKTSLIYIQLLLFMILL